MNRFDLFAGALCVCLMAVAIYMTQVRDSVSSLEQPAAVSSAAIRVLPEDGSLQAAAIQKINNYTMTITDIKTGEGAVAENGKTVSVHYVGRLDDGTEFDNSHKRGAPIEFMLGAGQVIAGWEEGILGMAVGGERTLVIPPEKAYGDAGIGPIPGGATLTFTVELVNVQ